MYQNRYKKSLQKIELEITVSFSAHFVARSSDNHY